MVLEVFGGPAIRLLRTRGFASPPSGEFARSEPLTYAAGVLPSVPIPFALVKS
jgi:hypothetical protein